jgi:RNA polymerase sigma factor (sigma-70 family)
LESQEVPVVSATKYKSFTDSELISMCLSGDGAAWEALIRRYRRLIYSVPVRFGFEEDDASDVFQIVCLKMLEHLHEIKDDRKISGWLVTTTTRQCLHLKFLKGRETLSDGMIEEPEDSKPNLEELRILTEQQQAMREAIDELAERCRSLIGMLYFDTNSPSYEEISRTLGMPIASIGPTRARCLEKLRTILRRRGLASSA